MNKELKKLVLTAVLAALAIALGFVIKITPGLNLEMPQGGNVFGINMLPLILIGIVIGWQYGLLGGAVYGVISLIMDGYTFHWGSFLLDYIIPFAGIAAVGGFFGKDVLKGWKKLALVFLCAFILRWISHGLSGVLIFADYAPVGTNAWFYSFILYNLPYLATTFTISFVIALGIKKQLILLTESFQ
ncbi:energy-coupled thiamine transporter ThiT [Acholeplasma equirhinis]|uniref:energy-coupled thiamine transporter ThiT n=1 Tax=Acholeplasma equirhinis TaxID=555393 RepID=UPI00197A9C55|nr:energy-coupled thiamine transporter ThiT [Acholeplasma equirhinis]MBN3490499.1 energy-coupled thiamine transporter ThiT [Acholeplasma equirhinis]